MLALTLKVGERIRIRHGDKEGWFTLRRLKNGKARVCLDFPREFQIDREARTIERKKQDGQA